MGNTEINRRRDNIVNVLSQNEEFILIGLTGRNGSGCSEAATIFGSSFWDLELPSLLPDSNGFLSSEDRDRRILVHYAEAHWLKFDVIKSRSVISSFLLEDFPAFLKETKCIIKSSKKLQQDFLQSVEEKYNLVLQKFKNKYLTQVTLPQNLSDLHFSKKKDKNGKDDYERLKDFIKKMEKKTLSYKKVIKYFTKICNKLAPCYQEVIEKNGNLETSRVIENIEEVLSSISVFVEYFFIHENKKNANLWKALRNINVSLSNSPLEYKGVEKPDAQEKRFERFVFVHDLMPDLGNIIHDKIKDSDISYTKLFQKYGNSIRCYGKIKHENQFTPPGNAPDVGINAIPQKFVQFIKILRHPFSKKYSRPVRIVLDSIKNVFEAAYLRQRYSSFYLFAISADENIRKNRLMRNQKKKLTLQELQFIDWNEYSSQGRSIFLNPRKEDEDELSFQKQVGDTQVEILYDPVREYAYKNALQQFYLQDVEASIENADVFISNNHDDTIQTNIELRWAIVRNVCLIMFPGLLTPTPLERCMQIAFAAKCNSGCLSRQVGAVVTDKNYNILSIGWNDVPCGDISCIRKNLVDLCKCHDRAAYTRYELTDRKFRETIQAFDYHKPNLNTMLRGLPMWYCFKDIHEKPKNPMRSRSMHAEEKALAACGNCEGGYLFTTSSPCEMCSKNAKNHKIQKIYYIELYPGISETQYTQSGDPANIAQHILFSGAVGRAYTKMYTPVMPQKDIIDLLGILDEYAPALKYDAEALQEQSNTQNEAAEQANPDAGKQTPEHAETAEQKPVSPAMSEESS